MLLKPVTSDAKKIIEHDGHAFNLRGWADFLDIPHDTLRMRYRRGLRGDELFKEVQWREKLDINAPNALSIEHMGETHNLAMWSRRLEIPLSTLYARYRAGKRGSDLFKPVRSYASKVDKKVV